MAEFTYHSEEDLRGLGQRVVDAAVDSLVGGSWAYDDGIPEKPAAHQSHVGPGFGGESPSPDLDYARNLLTPIPDMFASFAGPRPADGDTAIGTINAMRQALSDDIPTKGADQAPHRSWRPAPAIAPTLTAISAQVATNWSSTGATAFNTYIGHMTHIVDHQTNLAVILDIGMTAQQTILSWAYQDIWSIGTETINLLDAGGTHDCGPSANIALQIMSGVAWLVAAAATEGAEALAFTALAAATGSAGGFLPEDNNDRHARIHGTTMLSVISSMCDTIGTLITWIDQQQSLSTKRLSSAIETASGWYRATGLNGAGLFPPSPNGFSNPSGWTPQ